MPKTTTVSFQLDKRVVDLLEGGIAEGVLDTAQAGKEMALTIARSKFRTIRGFQRNAFAVAFDGIERKGDENGPRTADYRGSGPVGYFGYDWFVARFYETGTIRQRPRPSVAPAANELDDVMPARLAAAVKARGF
jgi:hypothetical protein